VLNSLATRLLKIVSGVSSVYYDITPKPPGTIEFE
jgi:GMP synthase PP-ATPase subunit